MSKYSAVKHLTKEDIIKNGSIFTPKRIVNICRRQLNPFLNDDCLILDMGSGYGAFIEGFKDFDCIGTDCDEKSIEILKQNFPDKTFYCENSLVNISRDKYSIGNRKLIIVGNPPYNDITSIYKKGQKGTIECDNDVKSRDLGISFLKCYSKLKAEFICVLHPLSYLIKKQNFKSLGNFVNDYKLISGTIFSSQEFETIKRTNAEFPVVAALYKRGEEMDYEYIKNFKFDIYKSKKKYILNSFSTIDGIIQKYPTPIKNEIQFYTLRDINSLFRNASFVEGPINNGVNVNIDNLYQYSWLLFFKENFKSDKMYLYGNLSPLYSPKIEKETVKKELISYAYNNNEVIRKHFSKDVLLNKYKMSELSNDYKNLFKILDELHI